MLETVCLGFFVAVLAWIISRRSQLRLRVRVELATALLAIAVAVVYIVLKRFEGGLGAVTNLSDRTPWGLWIAADLCGVALAAGGFVLAASVHVLKIHRFDAILRPTVLTAFIAYVLVAVILVFDLGRPYRFWHPLIMWQPHSVMFEITVCLTLYSLVLALEFSPALFEKLGWRRAVAAMRGVTLPAVILGVILSTLHQSSFGSLFLIVPHKLSQFWYSPLLPLLFFISAVCAGMAVVILESHLCATFLRKQLPQRLMVELGRACSVVLWVYLAAKVGDVVWRGAWRHLGDVPWLDVAFGLELLVGVAIPALWLARMPTDRPPRGLIAAASMVVGGVVLNRLNISWFGLLPYAGTRYIPSWMELALTAAVALAGSIAFLAVSQFLPVFPEQD